jgi:hypothetical protein
MTTFPYTIDSTQDSNHTLALVRAHGAVRVRGVLDFARYARSLGLEVRRDLECSAGPRVEVTPGVHTSNEAPPSEHIPVHHEMAQCAAPPAVVAFHCEVPPSAGGATPIVRSSEVARELRARYPALADRLAREGVRYVREYPPYTDASSPLGKSWRDAFDVASRADFEIPPGICSVEWLPGERLRTVSEPTPPLLRRAHNGEEIFFTAAETLFLDTPTAVARPEKSFVHADGAPLDAESKAALLHVGRLAFERCTRVAWERGDVLLLDNETVMHARDSFEPPRRILVSLLGRLT